jgi:hypothetical protein
LLTQRRLHRRSGGVKRRKGRKGRRKEESEEKEGRKGKEEGCTVVAVQTPNPGCEDLERELEEDEKEEEKNRGGKEARGRERKQK